MSIVYVLDIIGTFVFAISGAMSASSKKLDLFGALFTGFITAVGGGSIRDLLIGATPVVWLVNVDYIVSIILGCVVALVFNRQVNKLRRTLFLFDTIGIATFTIIGLNKALMFGVQWPMAVLLGVVSAVMGGVLRDTFVNDIPLVLRREIYATACFIGAFAYLGFNKIGFGDTLNLLLTVSLIIIIRLLSVRYRLSLPIIHDKK